jgi:hypothetical protein
MATAGSPARAGTGTAGLDTYHGRNLAPGHGSDAEPGIWAGARSPGTWHGATNRTAATDDGGPTPTPTRGSCHDAATRQRPPTLGG